MDLNSRYLMSLKSKYLLISKDYVLNGGLIVLPYGLKLDMFKYSKRIKKVLRLVNISLDIISTKGYVVINVFIPIHYESSERDFDSSLFMSIKIYALGCSNPMPKMLGKSIINIDKFLRKNEIPLEYKSENDVMNYLPSKILELFEDSVIPNLSVEVNKVINVYDINTSFDPMAISYEDIDDFIYIINKDYYEGGGTLGSIKG